MKKVYLLFLDRFLGLFVDRYQRVYRADGVWIRRETYSLSIPIREELDDAYQTVYFKKSEISEDQIESANISMLGDFFLSNEIPESPQLGVICEYIGMPRKYLTSIEF